jgi:hypothetical protein
MFLKLVHKIKRGGIPPNALITKSDKDTTNKEDYRPSSSPTLANNPNLGGPLRLLAFI